MHGKQSDYTDLMCTHFTRISNVIVFDGLTFAYTCATWKRIIPLKWGSAEIVVNGCWTRNPATANTLHERHSGWMVVGMGASVEVNMHGNGENRFCCVNQRPKATIGNLDI